TTKQPGAAYLFDPPQSSPTVFTDPSATPGLGRAVAVVDATDVLVADPDAGVVFRFDGSARLLARLTPPSPTPGFGTSLGALGRIIFVGSRADVVYLFDAASSSLTTPVLQDPAPGRRGGTGSFGQAVGAREDPLKKTIDVLVGAPPDNEGRGAAFLF